MSLVSANVKGYKVISTKVEKKKEAPPPLEEDRGD
jgi:hypothetical protein